MTHSPNSEDTERRRRVLEALRRRKGRALHVSEVRGRIGIDKSEHAELFRLLEQLAEDGLVTQLPGGRFRFNDTPPAPRNPTHDGASGRKTTRKRSAGRTQSREGSLIINARGFGFVATEGEDEDVFIPPAYLGNAMHGDTVRIRASRGPKGLDGRVLEVVKRVTRFVGGQLHISPGSVWLEADDERLRMPIHVEGKLPPEARTGIGVIARVTGYPEREGEPLLVCVEETFEADEFVQFEIRRILLRESIRETFPDDVAAAGALVPTAVPAADKREREDLRSIPLLTIDPEDARDHDDAVWAKRLSTGYRVIIAIADVSHYVEEGSLLDQEALERGCTIYLPSRAIPMLPESLSSNLASLVPRRDRLTLAVEIDLAPSGAVKRHRFIEGLMRSAGRLSYEGVARALGLTEKGKHQPAAIAHKKELEVLLELAEILAKRRRKRGALEFELPEAKVRVDDETGHPIDVERSRKDPGVSRAYGMIEQLMLLANEVVAADLSARGLPTIYRVHAPPDPDRIETFCMLARALGFDLDSDVAEEPKKIARFLARIHGTPHARTLGYLLLRAMQQAAYDTDNVGHFGLAAKDYVHFTSPIRRYPDLAVHRIVRRIARGQRVREDGLKEALQRQAEQASQRERKAMSIEREVVDLYGAYLMRNQVGNEFEGVISGVTEHGFYATLDSPFVDVLCRVATLPADRYELDKYGVRLTGTRGGLSFALGDRINLRIQDVSIAQRKVIAVLADVDQDPRESTERSPRGPGHARKGRGRRPDGTAVPTEGHRRKQGERERGKGRRGKRKRR